MIIFQNHLLPFDRQKEKLVAIFNDWKGTEPQIDDVLVVGVKIMLAK